ncbi:hypothetical protein FN846DRAFT_733335 [Sphaerosporella brunnea]|uniref:Uncharacterized protein n=1 Tax=Sphaerosporella brunnea TaxID=1250544 RepID=A0A5J5EVW6_9PEZI|nr:hypothetical protein FN846DRAFT_733335 [Sphaerosporella brunnea]
MESKQQGDMLFHFCCYVPEAKLRECFSSWEFSIWVFFLFFSSFPYCSWVSLLAFPSGSTSGAMCAFVKQNGSLILAVFSHCLCGSVQELAVCGSARCVFIDCNSNRDLGKRAGMGWAGLSGSMLGWVLRVLCITLCYVWAYACCN